ncbi:MAG: hypothetical protein KGL53_03380 [Elusimicrobia bacterium]|nr:hypothetical protein [Elusimicrobiota bacterium]
MARHSKDTPVTRELFETTIAGLRHDMQAGFARFALEMDRRFAETSTKESVDGLHAKVDRFIAALDRSSGEALDIRRSFIVYDAMLAEHRRFLETHERRLFSLESRTPPQAS